MTNIKHKENCLFLKGTPICDCQPVEKKETFTKCGECKFISTTKYPNWHSSECSKFGGKKEECKNKDFNHYPDLCCSSYTEKESWEEKFQEEITFPFPEGKYKGWGIEPSQLLAIKSFIKNLLSTEQEKVKEELEIGKLVSNIALMKLLVENGTRGDLERLIDEFTKKLNIIKTS